MNKIRRQKLSDIFSKLEQLDSLREEIREQLDEVLEEEQDAFDNLPESFQESERGEQMQDYINIMQEAVGELDLMDIDSIIDSLEDIVGSRLVQPSLRDI